MPRPALRVAALSIGFAIAQALGAAAQTPTTPEAAPGTDPVVATFKGGEITRSEVLDFLGQYAMVPDRQEEVYNSAINAMVNQELLSNFLEGQNVAPTAAELDAEVAKLGDQLKESGQGDLNALMTEMQLSPTELRERLATNLRWTKYLRTKADPAALKAYFVENEPLFTGAAVKASHILVRVAPDASEEAKEAARVKLADLKAKIEGGELSFGVAADRDSEDPSNQEAPDGGNIGYFGLRGQVDDTFAEAAFALETGAISDPVETPFGYHLITVTDRREGQAVDFEQNRDAILATYGEDLREQIIEDARDQADLQIKPMPEDFFPAPAPANLGGTTGAPVLSPTGR